MDILSPEIPEEKDNNPLSTALLGFGFSMLGFFIIGSLVGVLFAIPFVEGGVNGLLEFAADPTSDPSYQLPLLVMQGVASFTGLVVIPLIFLKAREKSLSGRLSSNHSEWIVYLLTFAGVIMFMGVNSIVIDWNSSVSFPEFMKGFEEWARQNEDTLAEATTFITHFDSFWMFLLGFIVIAVIPAIGEELVFRGLLQRKLIEATVNPHLAIWISAILFSAIHIQFFGFFPRMFLGALFGYLYFWTGDLKIAMFAHFVNNAFTLVMVYLNQLGWVDFDLENTESPALYSVILFAIITAITLYIIHKKSTKTVTNESMADHFQN